MTRKRRDNPDTPVTPTPLGIEIKRIREVERKLPQDEVAFRSGMTQSDLSKIEIGRTKKPGKKRIIAIAEALEWDADPLLILADYAPTVHSVTSHAVQGQTATAKADKIPGAKTLLQKFNDPSFLAALSATGLLDSEETEGLRRVLERDLH